MRLAAIAGLREATERLDPRLRDVRSMLSYTERALLYLLARNHVDGRGAIVDAGCFVGGSTLALAMGLRDNRGGAVTTRVHSYDMFRYDSWSMQGYLDDLSGLIEGADLRPVFQSNIAGYEDLVVVHAGDLREQQWHGEPIEVLFIDIAKSWELNHQVARMFFPSLVPGHSVIVQQDLVHWGHPWTMVLMEHYADHFRPLGYAWFSSMVYLCTRPFDRSELERDLQELPLERKLELVDQAKLRIEGDLRESMDLSKALMLAEAGLFGRALAHVGAVEARLGTRLQFIDQGYRMIRQLVSWRRRGQSDVNEGSDP
jgi:predicted O-methyltransferase YrrM